MKRSIAQKGSKKLKATFKEKAHRFEKEKEYAKSEETFLEWIDTSPECTDARHEYASFLTRRQEYTKAKAVVEKAILLKPNLFKLQKQLASILECEGFFEKALKVYNFTYTFLSAQASNKELGSLLCDRATVWRVLGHTDKAICDLHTSLKLFPSSSHSFPAAQWDLGMMLRKEGKKIEAQKHFDLAMKFNNNLSKWHGDTYMEFLMDSVFRNEYDEACQVARFPCHNLCSAVSIDLMMLNWAKLTPGLRNFVRQACTTVFRNVVQKHDALAERYESAIAETKLPKSRTKLPKWLVEGLIAFLTGDPSLFV